MEKRILQKAPGGRGDNEGVPALTMESTFPNGKHPHPSSHALHCVVLKCRQDPSP